MRSHPGIILALALMLAAAALWQGVGSAFVFDSLPAIAKNPRVQGVSWELDSWRAAALSSNSGSLGRPVTMLTFALNQLVAGDTDATPFKITNIFIHLAIALLLFCFSRRLLLTSPRVKVSDRQAMTVAALAAGLWVLQPLAVATVLYVVQRMAQLATLFTVLGLYVYVHYRGRWVSRAPPAGELVAAAIWLSLITALAVFSKENGLLLLWALVVVELCFYAGAWGGRELPWLDRLTLVALFIPVLLGVLLVLLAPHLVLDAYDQRPFTLEQRLQTQSRVLWQYVLWFISPLGPGAGLHYDDFPLSGSWLQPWTTALATLAWLLLLPAALVWRRRYPVFAFTLLFYLVTQSMESSIFALEMVYQHRAYLPSVGLALGLSWVIFRFCARFAPLYLPVIGVSLLLAMTFSTWSRASAWSDELLLSRINLLAHPRSARSHYHYANASLRAAGQTTAAGEQSLLLEQARQGYRQMYALAPGSFAAAVSLIYIEARYYRDNEAVQRWFGRLRSAAASRVMQAEDFNALGLLVNCRLANLCDLEYDALTGFLEAVRERGGRDYYLYELRARLLAGRPGRSEDAIAAYRRSIAARPGYPAAYYGLASLLNDEGRGGEAVEVLRRLNAHDASRVQLAPLRSSLEFAVDD